MLRGTRYYDHTPISLALAHRGMRMHAMDTVATVRHQTPQKDRGLEPMLSPRCLLFAHPPCVSGYVLPELDVSDLSDNDEWYLVARLP